MSDASPPPVGEPGEPADIAALGLAAAASVVERVLELSRSAASLGWRLPLPPNADPRDPAVTNGLSADPVERAQQARRFRADSERLVELYAEWTRTVVDQVTAFAEQSAPAPASGGGSVLVVGPVAPGATAVASAWLHVLDGPPAPPAPLHATPLAAHDAAVLPGSAITCEPPTVDTSASRTSQEVAVQVAVPAEATPGTYHGYLLAYGLPEIALAVRVEVVA